MLLWYLCPHMSQLVIINKLSLFLKPVCVKNYMVENCDIAKARTIVSILGPVASVAQDAFFAMILNMECDAT